MTDKNLFLYNLAVVAIFKDEGRYLKEWLDYHLLAGVEHFYLYNNDSSDDYSEVLAPYVENNLVTLSDLPGKMMQYSAYNDAIERFKFLCRYMAFIDCDEFIFPKTSQSVAEVVDEILSHDPNAAAVGINVQHFGSNGETKADYNRNVLERFTRRAPSDWVIFNDTSPNIGNIFIKSVVNPRLVDYCLSPHFASYFKDLNSINSDGTETHHAGNHPICADKIVINHYNVKSREEFLIKVNRGSACRPLNHKTMKLFDTYDRNEIFDDGILKYRATRAENFSLESDADKIRRVEKTLLETLTQDSPFDAPESFFVGKLETFLTCRALAEKLGTKIGKKSAEEYALVWIYQTLAKADFITCAEIQQFLRNLPEILARPFPFCKKIKELTQDFVLPNFCEALKLSNDWGILIEMFQLQKFLRLIK